MSAGRVFVTGASGRVGRAVARALVTRGFVVRALRHQTAVPADVEPIDGDLAAGWDAAPSLRSVDVVVHLAAVQQGTNDALRAVNVDGTAALARAAATVGVRRFVLASSATVYAPGSFVDADESQPSGPTDAYGLSKLYAERAAQAWFPRGLVCLRPCSIYGDAADDGLVRGALQLARAAALPAGLANVDLVHADDVAQCVVAALPDAAAGGTFHVAGPDRPRFVELMTRLAELEGRSPRFVDPHTAGDLPRHLVDLATSERTISIARARRDLGYAPRHGWATAFLAAARRTLSDSHVLGARHQGRANQPGRRSVPRKSS